jgi:hypothetical protein
MTRIALDQAPKPDPVLVCRRPIEMEFQIQEVHSLGSCRLPQSGNRGIARKELGRRKDQKRDEEQN